MVPGLRRNPHERGTVEPSKDLRTSGSSFFPIKPFTSDHGNVSSDQSLATFSLLCDANGNGNSYCNRNTYTNGNSYCNCNPNTHRYCNSNTYANGNADCNCNANSASFERGICMVDLLRSQCWPRRRGIIWNTEADQADISSAC
jgi:hypothetical protein